jgi:hypothetical protein
LSGSGGSALGSGSNEGFGLGGGGDNGGGGSDDGDSSGNDDNEDSNVDEVHEEEEDLDEEEVSSSESDDEEGGEDVVAGGNAHLGRVNAQPNGNQPAGQAGQPHGVGALPNGDGNPGQAGQPHGVGTLPNGDGNPGQDGQPHGVGALPNGDGNAGQDGQLHGAGALPVGDGGALAAVGQAPGNWLSYDSLMQETYPAKSKGVYLAAYRNFEIFLKAAKMFEPNVMPTEHMILNYFHHLKTIKRWGANTIWSTYSRLNGVFKRRFKTSFKEFPNLTNLLKSYEVGHRVKKANVFTPQQERFVIYYASCLLNLI